MPSDVDDKPSSPAAAQAGMGGIAIDRAGEVPVGVQLAWALRARIGAGRLAPGERLPGLREMAETSGLNVNTVRAVYQRLEQEGLIDSQQGSGTFVAAVARRPSPASTIAASAARAAAETGVDPREVAAALYVSPGSAERPPANRDAERRRTLRAQIAALERTLGEMEAAHPGLAPPLDGRRAGPGPSLPSAAELERVRAQLVRRLSVLQARIDEGGEADPRRERSLPPSRRTAVKTSRAAKPPGDAKPSRAAKPVEPAGAAQKGKADSKRPPAPRPTTRPAAAGT